MASWPTSAKVYLPFFYWKRKGSGENHPQATTDNTNNTNKVNEKGYTQKQFQKILVVVVIVIILIVVVKFSSNILFVEMGKIGE